MANFGRMLGDNIRDLMQKADIGPEVVAEQLNCGLNDVWNILEGKVVVIPDVLSKIAECLGVSEENLVKTDINEYLSRVECMEDFSNPDDYDFILDLIDEYVELVEA